MKDLLSPDVQAFLDDIASDPGTPVRKTRRQRKRKPLPAMSDFIPSIPRAWVMAAHFAGANQTAGMLLWRRMRVLGRGTRFPVSTGAIAKELKQTPQSIRQTWSKLEKAGLITVHERRAGRRLIVEINEKAGQQDVPEGA
jgi:DNA-binding transcriptional ArsR family regulator